MQLRLLCNLLNDNFKLNCLPNIYLKYIDVIYTWSAWFEKKHFKLQISGNIFNVMSVNYTLARLFKRQQRMAVN